MDTGTNNFFRGLFDVSTSEMKGYFILFLVVLVSFAVPVAVKISIDDDSAQEEKDIAMLDSMVRILDRRRPAEKEETWLIDPNRTSGDSLIRAGIREGVARRIVSYRQHGGQFRYREDLKKIYGMDDETYRKLESRLALPDSVTYLKDQRKKRMDINRAGIRDLILLAGLEEKLAGRVVKFGRLLGGYVSTDQFEDIYDLPEENLKLMKAHFFVSKNFVPVRININRAGWQELARHPYISEQLAKSILRYRELNGRITGMNELSAFTMVDDGRSKKLFPYLEF